MTATRGRICGVKKRHTTQASAAAHFDRLVAAGTSADAIEIYRCRYCGCLHVGHARRRKATTRDRRAS